MKQYKVTEPYVKTDCQLGESVFYDEATNKVGCLDMLGLKLHAIDLSQGPGSHKVTDLKGRAGKLVDLANDNDLWLISTNTGIGLLNKKTAASQNILELPFAKAGPEKYVSNDGEVDSHGRYWVGHILKQLDFSKYESSVWRVDPDLTFHEVLKGQGMPNGISFSPDDKVMYVADSAACTITAYDFDAAKGEVSNGREFFKGAIGDGKYATPDGSAVDVEGHLWTAVWGDGRVVRISPAGEVVAEVLLPASTVTDVAFAGEDLFISTMKGLDAPAEFAGHLYRCHVGVKGIPLHKFGLSKEFLASEAGKVQ